jgi:CheY-like chemotaxis protein
VLVLGRHLREMGGEEFARIYRALPPPHAAIVLLTGYVRPEAAGARVGAAAVVVKPFHLDELLAAVACVAQERARTLV